MYKVCVFLLNFLLLTLGLIDSRETDKMRSFTKQQFQLKNWELSLFHIKLIVKQSILRTENKIHFFESKLQWD